MAAIRSMWVYSLYLALVGLALVLVPGLFLRLFGFDPTPDVWIRVVGVLLLILAFYDGMAARTANMAFIRWSVPARLAVLPAFVGFVTLGWGEPMLVLFAAIDVAAAAWTWIGLRSDTRV